MITSSVDVASHIFEAFNAKPYDLFFLRNGAVRLLGRQQHLSPDERPGGKPRRRCCVTSSMIMGEAEREQILPQGVALFYRQLLNDRRDTLFHRLANDTDTDLYYPFIPWSQDGRTEWCAPREYWTPTPDLVTSLNEDELPIREYTLELLRRYDMTDKIIFDPACSTGEFLCSIKERYPSVKTFGQDISEEMVNYCRGRLDRVFCGDSLHPFLPEESADFVICRFLNFHVVTIAQAHQLLLANARRCRIGGHMLVIGHTPVLVSAQWFEILGLRVIQKTAYWPARDALFQFYWLRREGALAPLPSIMV